MKAIVNMFNTLYIDSSNELSVDMYKEKISIMEEKFAENNELCKLIDAYSDVFKNGEADNGVSTVVDEARQGFSIGEIMKKELVH